MTESRDEKIYSEALGLSSSVIYDKGQGVVTKITGVNNYTPSMRLVGKAYPVQTQGNILPILQSLEFIEKNYILVIEDSIKSKALMGDIVMLALKKKGVKGVLCNGCVRDIEHAEKIGISIWAGNLNPEAASLGERYHQVKQVTISGVKIEKDDWLFGDADGLVRVPQPNARHIIKSAAVKDKRERIYKKRIENGESLYQMMNIEGHILRGEKIVVEF